MDYADVMKETGTTIKISTLIEAKSKLGAKISRLEKLHKNAHGGYDFASVDDFKDEIRPLFSEFGLSLHVSEESYDLVQTTNKKGEQTSTAKIKFKFVIEHVSGERGEPSFLTVALPYTGAQTSGAAQSYAIKEGVYKGMFQASSGDLNEEADLQSQGGFVDRLSKVDAKPLYEALQKEMRSIETETKDSKELAGWWTTNIDQIRALPLDWFHNLKKECAETGLKLKALERSDISSKGDA
jgi:ERF superfamily